MNTHATTAGVPEKTLVLDEALRPGFTMCPNWLWQVYEQHDVSRDAILLYIYLLYRAWQDGECFPGQDRIAHDMKTTRQAISRWLKELQSVKLVTIQRRGGMQTNIYHLNAWKPAPSPSDVSHTTHHSRAETASDGTPALHQPPCEEGDVTPMQHHDVTPMQHHDVTPTLHNKYSDDKDTEDEDTVCAHAVRPHEKSNGDDWCGPLISRVEKTLTRCVLNNDHRQRLHAFLERVLGDEPPAMRARFIGYVLSNNFVAQLDFPGSVAHVVEEDHGRWLKQGRPARKTLAKNGVIQMPRTYARHEPVMKGPADHLALAESIRRYKGDSSADTYLREHGLLRTDGA